MNSFFEKFLPGKLLILSCFPGSVFESALACQFKKTTSSSSSSTTSTTSRDFHFFFLLVVLLVAWLCFFGSWVENKLFEQIMHEASLTSLRLVLFFCCHCFVSVSVFDLLFTCCLLVVHLLFTCSSPVVYLFWPVVYLLFTCFQNNMIFPSQKQWWWCTHTKAHGFGRKRRKVISL